MDHLVHFATQIAPIGWW